MTCYFPLHAYKGKSTDADKTVITFRRSDSWRGVEINLPCGQCIGCRLERSRQWAVRCMHEASLYDSNSFVTLTYDDSHLPVGGTLVKSDFQNFMKRLRKHVYPERIRYFHCGEYGDSLGRPHYHALIFNYAPSDKKYFSGKDESKVFTSASLQSIWSNGFVVVGDVTFESAAYCARYSLKKVNGKGSKEFYGERLPEYATMSRGSKRIGTGGIGSAWFKQFKSDVYPRDGVVVRGRVTRPPRFYDTLLGREDRSTLELIKIKREEKAGLLFVDDVLSDGSKIRVSDTCDARLLVKEEVKRAEISLLRRPLEDS